MVKVSITKSETPDVKRALALVDYTIPECDLVVFKPDLSAPFSYATGATTDLRILEQLIKLFEDQAKEIVIAESNPDGGRVEECFERTGVKELCDFYGCGLVNLSREPGVPVEREYNALKDFRTPRTILKADVLVNVPKMKTHMVTTVSLSLMNLVGIIPGRKAVYNPMIEEIISDLLRIRRPDINILDGMVAMEGRGPLNGTPKKMDLVMASTDAVSLDTVACRVMGVNPNFVEHIVRAGYHGLGEYTNNKIQIVGKKVEEVRDKFEPAV
jgi:uncharacterized protein (DUF362 family)